MTDFQENLYFYTAVCCIYSVGLVISLNIGNVPLQPSEIRNMLNNPERVAKISLNILFNIGYTCIASVSLYHDPTLMDGTYILGQPII